MAFQDPIEWCVKEVSTAELQNTLNWMEKEEYNLDKYEQSTSAYGGVIWVVVGFRTA